MLGQRRAAVEARKRGALDEVDPSRRRRLAVHEADDREHRRLLLLERSLELAADAAPVSAAERALGQHDEGIDELVCRRDADIGVGLRRHLRHLGDDERFLVVRHEAGGGEPLRQVGRAIVAVELPFDVTGDLAEPADEPLDLRISIRFVQIGPEDGAPVAPR